MKREFLINILFLLSINVIIKPFYLFGIDLKVQNEIDSYGLYFALLNLSYILQIITDLGIHQYNNRTISQHNYLFEKYFPHLLILKGGLSLIFLIIAFSVALIIGYRSGDVYILSFLLFNQIFITLTFFFRSNISGLQHYRLDSLLSVLDKLLMILICFPLLWGPWLDFFRIEWFVYAQTAAFSLTSLSAFFLTKKFMKKKLKFKFNLALYWVILKKCFPYSLIVLLMTIYTRVDAVMIERLLYDPVSNEGIKQANIYAAAYRLLDAINMICFLFAGLLLPMFSKMLKKNEDFFSLLKLSSSIMIVITVSFSIAFCVNAQEIMQLLYTNYNESMTAVVILLMIGFNSIGMIHIVGTLLTANGNLFKINIVITVGILINVVSNYFLILKYGALGAAVSTVITQSFVAIAEFYIAVKVFQISMNFGYIFRVVFFVTGVILINYLLFQSNTFWIARFLIAGFLSVIWAFSSKILDFKSIFLLFRVKTI